MPICWSEEMMPECFVNPRQYGISTESKTVSAGSPLSARPFFVIIIIKVNQASPTQPNPTNATIVFVVSRGSRFRACNLMSIPQDTYQRKT